jgi:secretion/DNA translocation related TadE-like protein
VRDIRRRVYDSGSASLLAVALMAMAVLVTAVILPLYIGLSVRQSVIGAADAAALAAADVVAGHLPGVPCEVAETVTIANNAALMGCVRVGLIVTVTTNRSFLGFTLQAEARAGPPGSLDAPERPSPTGSAVRPN